MKDYSLKNFDMPLISIISPVYMAEDFINELVNRLVRELSKITDDYEIILVEDGSPDESWDRIRENALKNPKIRGIKLSRNFGQHYAITAGLDASRGEWVVVMDCDLQDQPEEIIKLYQKSQEGFDIVLARRYRRRDTWVKRFFSKGFYGTLSYLTGAKQDYTVANFGIYNRKVIHAIKRMRESIRYFPTMVRWVGFETAKIDVAHASRSDSKSSYNFKRLMTLALDIMLAYSDKPLRLTVKLGLIISTIALLFAIISLVRYFKGEIVVMGYASLILSIWMLAGFIIFILGVIGLYIGKTFEGVKNRPIYIVSEKVNFKSVNVK